MNKLQGFLKKAEQEVKKAKLGCEVSETLLFPKDDYEITKANYHANMAKYYSTRALIEKLSKKKN